MSLSDFEISKITEIVAGRIGANLDAKSLRQVVDRVVDELRDRRGNPQISGGTCETERSPSGLSSLLPRRPTTFTPRPPDEELLGEQGGLYEQIERTDKTRIIIAAFGKNRPGVVAAITAVLADLKCSIEDISQTIMQDFFSMIMIVDISGCSHDFSALRERIQATESQLGMKVYVMHEDIFRYMHRI